MRRGWRYDTPVVGWSLVVALLVLGPGLGDGFLLVRDMVWVPDLALRADVLGLGSGLPRAVPSDAVVAVLDEVVPGLLLFNWMEPSVAGWVENMAPLKP